MNNSKVKSEGTLHKVTIVLHHQKLVMFYRSVSQHRHVSRQDCITIARGEMPAVMHREMQVKQMKNERKRKKGYPVGRALCTEKANKRSAYDELRKAIEKK